VKVYSNQQVFTALRDQRACPVRIWRIIHNLKTNTKTLFHCIESQLGAQEAAGERSLCEGTRGNCTKYWHGAVDGVHLIENTAVAGGDF
jgi:hypothetical protein